METDIFVYRMADVIHGLYMRYNCWDMNAFKSIDELLRVLEREKVLLKQMFQKRPSTSLKHDYALELTEYKEDRVRYLIDYGVIRDSGNFLEMEDVYLKFFEDVLQVNENINVSFVDDYLGRLNENIEYYLKEDNEQRKYNYHKEVRRCLKNIAMITVRNVIDLKRNIDNTYKNEPNYRVKLSKLKNLDEKRKSIALLISRSEDVIENQQLVFFRVAMDTQMRMVVSDVKLQLNDSYHNLIEIEKQIIHYLNLVAYQNRIFEKVRRLKYLRDQFLLEEKSDIRQILNQRNPVWMEPQASYRIKLSVGNLRTSATALELIRKVVSKRKNLTKGPKNMAGAIPREYLETDSEVMDSVNLQEVYNAFAASGSHLFKFVMGYNYHKNLSTDNRILFFCQIASQYADVLNFTDTYETSYGVEYPLIYSK